MSWLKYRMVSKKWRCVWPWLLRALLAVWFHWNCIQASSICDRWTFVIGNHVGQFHPLGDHTFFPLEEPDYQKVLQKYLLLSEQQALFSFFNESHEKISRLKNINDDTYSAAGLLSTKGKHRPALRCFLKIAVFLHKLDICLRMCEVVFDKRLHRD